MNLSSLLNELEKQIADYMGTRYAIICSSARAAIRFTLLALKIGFRDRVIIPDFVCQILPITVFCTGASPVFCDVDKENFTISSEHMSKIVDKNTKGIIFTHLYGTPVDPSPILDILRGKDVFFIDDTAQSLGASINGKMTGTFGDVGIITFNKFLNIGLGGAAVTNDEKIASRIRNFRAKYEDESLFISFNYRIFGLLNLNSKDLIKLIFWSDGRLYKLLHVILAKKHFQYIDKWMTAKSKTLESWRANSLSIEMINQLMNYGGSYWHRRKLDDFEISLINREFKKLDEYLEKRRSIAKIYDDGLKEKNIIKPKIIKNHVASYLKYPVLFDDKRRCSNCIEDLTKEGFRTIYKYRPLHTSPFFKEMVKRPEFINSVFISDQILPLPVDLKMSAQEVEKVISIVNSNQS